MYKYEQTYLLPTHHPDAPKVRRVQHRLPPPERVDAKHDPRERRPDRRRHREVLGPARGAVPLGAAALADAQRVGAVLGAAAHHELDGALREEPLDPRRGLWGLEEGVGRLMCALVANIYYLWWTRQAVFSGEGEEEGVVRKRRKRRKRKKKKKKKKR